MTNDQSGTRESQAVVGTFEERMAIYKEHLPNIREQYTKQFELAHPEWDEICSSHGCFDCPLHDVCEESEVTTLAELGAIYGADVVAADKQQRKDEIERKTKEQADAFAEFLRHVSGSMNEGANAMMGFGISASNAEEAEKRFAAIADDMKQKCADCDRRDCEHHPEYDASLASDDDDDDALSFEVVGIDELLHNAFGIGASEDEADDDSEPRVYTADERDDDEEYD